MTKISTPSDLDRLRRLTAAVDVALGLSMLLLVAAAVIGALLIRGLWPPRTVEPPSLHSSVQ